MAPRGCSPAVAAACLALAACPAPAAAQSGGAWSSAPAVIDAVTCRADCLDARSARPGSVVRLAGREMIRVRSIVFLGGPGAADDRTAPALRWSGTIADARVPEGAVSGRVRTRNGDGTLSRPSTATVQIGAGAPAPAGPVPGPGKADRDTSDRIDARVDTQTVFFAAQRKAVLRYVVTGGGPLEVAVELVRATDGTSIQRWTPGAIAPGAAQQIAWDGTAAGLPAPEGRYEFRVFPLAAAAAADGAEPPLVADSFRLLDHKFPVRGVHTYGTDIARFGAVRSGHSHQGHDVFAACGTPLVAARGGVVRWKAFQDRAGNYLVIDGDGTDTDYAYMHLQAPALVERGQRVATGQRIGNVGDTGAAHGCHLHFELWGGPGWYEGGKAFDPLPLLQAWDAQSGVVTKARAAARRR